MPSKPDEIHSTTQTFLDIFDITNDILINKDGSTALILQVNAINFGLLAEEEQDAIMYAYASLLNSLNYPIQIVIRSQTKDVTNYLNLLKEEEDKAVAPLQKERISRYRAFVAELIKERNVLDKKFYVAIPASSLEMGLLPPSTVLPGVKQPDLTTVERSVILDKATEVLEPKRDHLISQFARIGLVARQLTTQEIIQLFYLSYNPEAAEGQQLTDTNSYTTPLVRASVQGGYMPDTTSTATPTVAPDTTTPMPPTMTPPAAAPIAAPAVSAQDAPSTPPMTTPAAPSIQEQPSVTPPTSATPTPVSPVAPASPAPSLATLPTPPASTPAAPSVSPAAPTPGSASITPPPSTPAPSASTPSTPAAPTPAESMTTPPVAPASPSPASEADIQAEINSSLKQLGTTPMGGEVTPTSPSVISTGGTSIPPTQPPTISSPAAASDKTDEMPPVAEI